MGRDRARGRRTASRTCNAPSPRRCAGSPSASRSTSWPSCATTCARPKRSSSARCAASRDDWDWDGDPPEGVAGDGADRCRRGAGGKAAGKVGWRGSSQVGTGVTAQCRARHAARLSRARRPDAVRLRLRPHAPPSADGAQGPPGRQGRQPGRDDVRTRAARPAGLHDLDRRLPGLHGRADGPRASTPRWRRPGPGSRRPWAR